MKLAVIGSGIAGNSAALALARRHDVTLYEKRDRPGGHSATVDLDYDGVHIPVDTGFIVYNTNNYPLLTKLFEHLGTQTTSTTMSFSVSLDQGRFEWCGDTLRTIFAQKSNLFSPGFFMMLGDILRFNSLAKRDLDAGTLCGITFGDYIRSRGFSTRLRDDYIVPMTAAIWSTPAARMLDFPAESLVRFLDNHRLIQLRRPCWRTVTGGSRNYVNALLNEFPGTLLLDNPVERIIRQNGKVYVTGKDGHTRQFDGVVMASHSDQTLKMLADRDADETSVLSSIPYRPNRVWLHRDASLMPKRKDAWAAWNYLGTKKPGSTREITVTYWMNKLQNINTDYPIFITLNPQTEPREDLTFATFDYSHPQFDAAALAAQERLPAIQGRNNTWYCGAWTRFGFHEDGLASGLHAAKLLGCKAPWETDDTVDIETIPNQQAILEAVA